MATADHTEPHPETMNVATKLSELLVSNRERSELVDMQTELIMLTVRAFDDDCPKELRALLHHVMRQMRTHIDSRAK